VIDDEGIDELVRGLYVRLFWERSDKNSGSKYRLHRIEKTMDYPTSYNFMGDKITKGLQVSYGAKITNQKLTKVHDDDFTEKELISLISLIYHVLLVYPVSKFHVFHF